MLEIGLKCDALLSFVHVSTAYVNCNQPSGSVINEKLYPLGFEPERILDDIERMNAQQLAKVSDTGLLRDYPNTYTFTKSIAEHLLIKMFKAKSNGRFALSLARPAIVCAAWKEPMPGWIDDISAASAIYAGGALGVLKFIPAKDYKYDLIPVDLVANGIILAAPASLAVSDKILILHCGSSSTMPVTFRTILPPTLQYARENPPKNAFSKPSMDIVSTPQLFQLRFFLQYSLPASILNTIALFGSKKNKRQVIYFLYMLLVHFYRLRNSNGLFLKSVLY
jgi:fatty acyl-CoA reductase